MYKILKRLRSLFRVLTARHDFEAGMSEELRFHVEQYTHNLVRSGLTAEEARRRASIEFGSFNNAKGECRQARGLHIVDEAIREQFCFARFRFQTQTGL